MVDEDKVNRLFEQIDEFTVEQFNREHPSFIEIDNILVRLNDKYLREKLAFYIDWYTNNYEQEKLKRFVIDAESVSKKKDYVENCYK